MRPGAVASSALAVVLLAACTVTEGGEETLPPSTPPQTSSSPSETASPSESGTRPVRAGTPEVLAKGLEVPWGVTFLPDRSALVSERDTHRIVRVTLDGDTSDVGRIDGVSDDTSEGGLLGLAVSPDFADDQLVYAYFTARNDNRIVSFRFADGKVSGQRTVFTGIPKAGNHDGGRVAFGPDDLLYVTTGDATQADRAQDRDFLGGKVLRMTADGKPAPGNPFPDSVVYTLGHRNPQGLAWGPGDRLYEAEFGQDTQDELNLLRPGRNYGWPDAEGDVGSKSARFERPLATWSTGDASPSGLAYAGGSLWLATLQGENVYRMNITQDGKVTDPRALYDDRWGRLRTVVPAPDGSLWVTTSNKDGRGSMFTVSDRIIRIPLG